MMETLRPSDRNLLVARIVSGQVEIKDFIVKPPTRQHRLKAEEIYFETYREAEAAGVMYEEDALDLLHRIGIWSSDKESQFMEIPKQLDECKVGLFENQFKSNEIKRLRASIKTLERKLTSLTTERTTFDSITCEGIALLSKMQYLICCNVETELEWNSKDPLSNKGPYINLLFNEFFVHKIEDRIVRYLSRTDPWRSIWNSGKITGLGLNSLDMTEDQRSLILWSRMYDSVFDSPECPDQSIIDDDDTMDGWLIVQSRRREAERKKAMGDKYGNAGEIFIPVDTAEDAKKVFQMNDSRGKMLQKERASIISKKGQVKEEEFPDAKLEMIRLAREQRNGL